MYLSKLLLKDFGKFNNKEIDLKPGLNLIYGGNEAGKTTIKDFIVGMLYGMEKARGLKARFDDYELRKPLSGRGFSGKAYIKKDDRNYFVERSFLRHNRRVTAMDINSGKELDLRNTNTLQGELFDVDKNTYQNTLCIGERGATPGKELAADMGNYLANLSTTGSADIDKDRAIERLKAEKKKYDTKPCKAKVDIISEELLAFERIDDQIKEIRGQISEVEQEFAMETARRKREARKLIESEKGTTYEENEELNDSMDELAKKAVFLDADLIKDYKKELPLTDRVWFILLTGVFVVAVIAAMVYILPFENSVRQLFIICTILFVLVTIVEGMYAKGMLNGDIYTPTEEEFKKMIYDLERKQETFEEVEIDMTFAKEFLDKKAELLAVEKELLDKKERRSQLEEELATANERIAQLEQENHVINLAINTINQVSAEIHGDLGFLINDNISDIVSKITNGKYKDVRMDEKLHVMVKDEDSYVGIEYLSAGTIEQIYLAVRLSVARLLCRDKMPLIIDDIFTAYDETRLVNTLDCLKTIDTEQIILLTGNPHIGDMLDDLDMDYNYVEL
ncbi:MAG: AAA family ATPase [Lachnospiraceae bacterium]|nr:AAA family ATPase [Lachnospiraceae bacterium]